MPEKFFPTDQGKPLPQSLPNDKRYLPRWQVNNRVVCTLQGDPRAHEAVSRDLNCMGVSITTNTNFTVKQKAKLKIYLSDDAIVKVDGHVIWTHAAEDHWLLGILFENISREAQDLLLQYAYEIKKSDVVKHWFTGWTPSSK